MGWRDRMSHHTWRSQPVRIQPVHTLNPKVISSCAQVNKAAGLRLKAALPVSPAVPPDLPSGAGSGVFSV